MDRSDPDARRRDGPSGRSRRWLAAGVAVGAGVLAGAVVSGGLTRAGDPPATAALLPAASTDTSWGWRSWWHGSPGDGDAVPADAAARVRDAVAARDPGATVGWVRPDAAGGYVAYGHTADGTHVAWSLDGGFAVTGTEVLPEHDRDGRAGNWRDGDLPADAAARVRDAVTARFPGAVVWRVQSDGSGGYLAKADTGTGGEDDVLVRLDASFVVTGSEPLPR
ncbi:hypothetical protein [Geodermatophilus sp. CPCC 206100]|uniref:hypothetical protein n=1 Tax=Geodermatophilus sp. CPCC 206100 TaxID=3020054 RepID=UPI003AFF82F3